MTTALQIVNVLLETDEPGVDADTGANPETYLHGVADKIDKDAREGKLTPQTALTASNFYHRTLTYKDGVTPLQARRNGATKTWRTRPGEFRIPCKYGMYDYFYIDQNNAHEWSIIPLPQKEKPVKRPVKPKPVVNPSSLMPPL